jgi:hypothetical protein
MLDLQNVQSPLQMGPAGRLRDMFPVPQAIPEASDPMEIEQLYEVILLGSPLERFSSAFPRTNATLVTAPSKVQNTHP